MFKKAINMKKTLYVAPATTILNISVQSVMQSISGDAGLTKGGVDSNDSGTYGDSRGGTFWDED